MNEIYSVQSMKLIKRNKKKKKVSDQVLYKNK